MKQAYIIERDEVMQALAQMYKRHQRWDDYAEILAEDVTATPEEVQLAETMQADSFKEFNGALDVLTIAGVFDSWAEGLTAVHDYIYRTR